MSGLVAVIPNIKEPQAEAYGTALIEFVVASSFGISFFAQIDIWLQRYT
mgnify:FL=1